MTLQPKIPRRGASEREVEQWRLALKGDGGYIPKVPGATDGNLSEWTSSGTLRDSGIKSSSVAKLSKVVTISGAYVVQASDGTILIDASGGDIAITHISAVGISGDRVTFKRIDNSDYTATVTAGGTEKIDNDSSFELYGMESVVTQADGANWWII